MKKLAIVLLLGCCLPFQPCKSQPVWSVEKAQAWYRAQPWLVGCNFIPSTAINELEMWQAETFDSATINRELGWAEGIGMNTVRVFLHFVPWQSDPAGFRGRMNTFLNISSSHGIRPIFVLFDDCWNPDPKPGKQPDPKTGIHNSGWMQCPGKKIHDDPKAWAELEAYEKDILMQFRNDSRVLAWDLYNEPGNSHYGETTLPLLKKVFEWAWEVRPSQPLTCGIWFNNDTFNQYQLSHSDIISFHNYEPAADLEKEIKNLEHYGRPMICTEYMARPRHSTFQTHLPLFKQYRVGAINWGLVSGKTNTIYQWDTPMPDGSEPKTWFHDIFRKNGAPYDPAETSFIRQITSKK